MNLERYLERENNEVASKLFRHVRFKGGGGSGGGQNTNTVQKADPWSGQQEYLTYGFDQAQNRYQTDQPNFYPSNTISPFNQNELGYQQNVLNYASSGRPQAMQSGAENAINQELLSNPNANPIFSATRGLAPYGQQSLVAASNLTDQPILDSTGVDPVMSQMLSGSVQQNPFIQNAVSNFADDAVSNFEQKVMPSLRASQTAYQQGGSSRGDVAAGLATQGLTKSIADFSNRSYMNAFDKAQQQQMQAANLLEQSRGRRANEALAQGQGAFNLGLGGEQAIGAKLNAGLGAYGGVSQMPVDTYSNVADIGMAQREMEQQMLDEDVNRYQFDQNIEDQKLSNYMNMIQGNYGGNTVTSASRGGGSLAGNLSQAGGTIAAMAGLLGGE
jgi:hypothetical protein